VKIISSEFKNNEKIPSNYTCEGEDVNPPLEFVDVPEDAKSLALIVDDPDAPGKTWVHWVVFNIPPETEEIDEDTVPDDAILGRTDFGNKSYGGPCPPSGTHRYFFKLYALDAMLDLDSGASKQEVLDAMNGRIIEKAELVGIFAR
jgi:hypothetical protein